MSVAAVLEGVRAYIAAETGSSFYGAIGGRLYHVQGPENASLPQCIFGVAASAQPERHFDGTDRERWVLQFDIWVDQQTETPDTAAMELDLKLFRRLDRAITTATGYDRITCLCIARGQPEIIEDAWRVSSQFEIKGVRTS